jgi:uncharacterized protein YndB with AHSA1/START domain
MNFNKITIAATISAEKQKVWDYYTQPEHITKWNFASDDWQCPKAENDLQVGGKYFARMEAKDGSFGFDFEGVYIEVDKGKNFTYEMADGRQASVNFENKGKETYVTITFDAENENPEELQKAGWQAILQNFKKYTERN